MAEQNVILNVQINRKDIEQANDAIRLSKQSIDELKLANQKLAEQGKQNSKEYINNTATLKALNQTVRENERVLIANEKASMAAEGSIEQLRAQLSSVSAQWAKLSQEERENTEAGRLLSQQKLDLTNKLKEEEKATGDTRRNVGNYSEGVKEAIEQSGLFGKQLAILKQAQQGYQAASKVATGATRSFGFALAATGIGAIVVAIGALVSAFTSTQRGADAISKALAPVKAVFQGLIGIAQDLSTKLFDAFKNPKQAVLDLWEAIKINIVNRITAVPKLFKSVFDTIVSAFKFLGNSIKSVVADIPIIGRGIDKAAAKKNADEAAALLKKSIEDTGDALIQATTGLDKEQRKSIANFAKAQSDRLSIAAQTGKKIADLQIAIEEKEIDLTKRRADLNTEFERSKEIAQDDTKTEEERRAAAQRAIEAQNELLKQEQDFLDLRIEKKKLENSLNDTDREAKKELAELEAQRTQQEADASRKRVGARNLLETIDNQATAKELARIKEKEEAEKKAQEEKAAAAIEFAELVAERENQIIEEQKLKLLEDRAEGLITKQEYEDALLEIENETLLKSIAAAELAQEQALLNTQLTENERQRIINESNAIILEGKKQLANQELKVADEKAKKEEQIERSKENFKKQLQQQAFAFGKELAGQNTTLAKALGIAEVGISTQVAATAALAPPPTGAGPIAGIPLAAITVARGLANAAKIAGIGFAQGGFTGDGYGLPDSSGYKPAGIVHEGEYVIKKSMVDNPAFSGIINTLERSRLRGYADGGFVSRSASLPATQGLQNSQLQNTLSELRNMQPIVKVTDINRVSGQAQMVRVSGELS